MNCKKCVIDTIYQSKMHLILFHGAIYSWYCYLTFTLSYLRYWLFYFAYRMHFRILMIHSDQIVEGTCWYVCSIQIIYPQSIYTMSHITHFLSSFLTYLFYSGERPFWTRTRINLHFRYYNFEHAASIPV